MPTSRRSLLQRSAATLFFASLGSRFASAEAEPVRIGVLYDLSGPFAAGGSVACSVGTQIAIDLVNERGGVGGHKVVPINADCQSKVDVAINEAERLLSQEKVDIMAAPPVSRASKRSGARQRRSSLSALPAMERRRPSALARLL